MEEAEEVDENPNALSNFRISEPLRNKLKSNGIEALFPIQAITFGIILEGSDLVGRARTGQLILRYQWLEDSLVLGEKASEDSYILPIDKEEPLSKSTVGKKSEAVDKNNSNGGEAFPKSASAAGSSHNEKLHPKKASTSSEDMKNTSVEDKEKIIQSTISEASNSSSKSDDSYHYFSAEIHSPDTSDVDDKNADSSKSSSVYNPPDLNKNITGIFGKIINI